MSGSRDRYLDNNKRETMPTDMNNREETQREQSRKLVGDRNSDSGTRERDIERKDKNGNFASGPLLQCVQRFLQKKYHRRICELRT